MKITKQQLQQIIKEEMEAELSEDKYATEDDRPLGTGRSLMSAEDAKKASKDHPMTDQSAADHRQTWKITKVITVTRPASHLI